MRRILGGDVLAVALLGATAVLFGLPGILHGPFFGSYDLVLHFGLGQGLVPGVHNATSGDTARQGAAWAVLNWRAVHSGHLPLWDPYVVLGLPQAANLQSGPASLPSLVSYLFPLRDAYSVTVLVKLFVGGTGCYLAARTLRTSRPSALLAGVVGEVGGPMAAWAGWPQTGVAEWTGWLVAGVLLVAERPSRRRVAALAVIVAGAVAGGFPELLVVLAVAGVVLAVVLLVRRWPDQARLSPSSWRRAGGLALAVLVGAFLSAPLWVPAVPVLARSVTVGRQAPALPLGEAWLFLDPFYWGKPVSSSVWFGPSNYYETAAFVGPAVVALALLAVISRWRDRRVAGLAAAAAVVLLLGSDLGAVVRFEQAVPGLSSVAFGRGLLVACDLLGLLGAVGLDAARRADRRADRRRAGLAVVVVAVPELALLASAGASGLSPAGRAARLEGALLGLVPLAALVLLLAARRTPAGRQHFGYGAGALAALEAASLLLAGAGQATWSSRFLPSDPVLSGAVRDAGGQLVALGGQHPPGRAVHLGVLADLNAAYGLRELAGYDAMMPRALERAWASASPAPDLARAEVAGDLTSFVPEVSTPAEASALGVSLLLEPLRPPVRLVDSARARVDSAMAAAGVRSPLRATGVLDALEWLSEQPSLLQRFPLARPGALASYLGSAASSTLPLEPPTPHVAVGAAAARRVIAKDPAAGRALQQALLACFTRLPPTGAVVVARLGDEVLLRFAHLGGASFVRGGAGTVVVPLRYRSDASAEVTVTARRPGWLRLGIDAEPGWSAEAAGRPLRVGTAEDGAVLAVEVPAGRSQVDLSYWPEGLTAGLLLALAGILAIVAAEAAAWARCALGARQASREPAGGGRGPSVRMAEPEAAEPVGARR